MPVNNQIQNNLNIQTLTSYIDKASASQSAANANVSYGAMGNAVINTGVSKALNQAAKELIADVKNITLTNDDVKNLYQAQPKAGFALGSQDGVIFVKQIKGELTLEAADILLGAAKRDSAESELANPSSSPTRNTRPNTHPPVSQHGKSEERIYENLQFKVRPQSPVHSPRTNTPPPVPAHAGRSSSPSPAHGSRPSSPVHAVGANSSLDTTKLENTFSAYSDVDIMQKRPSADHKFVAVWPSSKGDGSFGIHLPGARPKRATTLEQAQSIVNNHLQQQSQVQQNHHARNVLASGAQDHREELAQFEQKLGQYKDNISKKNHPEYYHKDPVGTSKENKVDRFGDIGTMLHSKVGYNLNANRITVAGQDVAIATQYPKDSQIEDQLRLLVDNRTPSLTVLTEASQMANPAKGMTDYFSRNLGFNSGLTTQSELTSRDMVVGRNTDGSDLKANVFNLTINIPGEAPFTVPVLHVTNWIDKTAIDAESSNNIATMINGIESDGGAPVVHCRAGVGRTGQIVAAIAMQKVPNSVSAEEVINDMRYSRNDYMGQT
ncbi:protein-tyrosine phosphatase family protein, partial [Photobacterium damselae]